MEMNKDQQFADEEKLNAVTSWEEIVKEYEEDQKEREEKLQKEYDGYLKIPMCTTKILLLTVHRHDFLVFRQTNLPKNVHRQKMHYGKLVDTQESGHMSIVELIKNGPAYFICLCKNEGQEISLALQHGPSYCNNYKIISKESSKLCIIQQEENTRKVRKIENITYESKVYSAQLTVDYGQEEEEPSCDKMIHMWAKPTLGNPEDYLLNAGIVKKEEQHDQEGRVKSDAPDCF